MSDNILVELFRAEWCGHCKSFVDVWEKLINELPGVTFKKYEHTTENDKEKKEFEKNNINSFPTIIITTQNKQQYKGERTFEAIKEFIENLNSENAKPSDDMEIHEDEEMQDGGGIDYKYKYEKYKSKYEALKKQLGRK
jgi:thiol-disulfide isomerase/thioredoxin